MTIKGRLCLRLNAVRYARLLAKQTSSDNTVFAIVTKPKVKRRVYKSDYICILLSLQRWNFRVNRVSLAKTLENEKKFFCLKIEQECHVVNWSLKMYRFRIYIAQNIHFLRVIYYAIVFLLTSLPSGLHFWNSLVTLNKT